jgi:hypothetical protein
MSNTEELNQVPERPDPVKVAAELSHELQEALAEIETLKAANRELSIATSRAEAARDVLKELLIEAMRR